MSRAVDPAPALSRRVALLGLGLALLLVAPLRGAAAEDELPDPVIRRIMRDGRRVPLPPAGQPTRPRPVRPILPVRPVPRPEPRPAPRAGARRTSAPGELPAPLIRRPGDPARVQPGQPVPLRPEPRPAGAGSPFGDSMAPTQPGSPFSSEPPPRPDVQPRTTGNRIPGDVSLEVDPTDGLIEGISEGGNAAAIVMLGAPRIFRSPSRDAKGARVPGLSIKANQMVVWVNRDRVPALTGFSSLTDSITGSGKEGASGAGTTRAPARVDLGDAQNIVPAALREIYAEGAVELIFDDVVFRCERLYLDPHRFVALLVQPEFDGYAAGALVGEDRVPIHVRARKARLIGRGLTVFEDVEVSTSRADDRILLRGETLTVREFERGEGAADAPGESHLLGYRRSSTQEYTLRRIRLQGERIPLFYWPYLAFGFSTKGEAFASVVRGIDVGRRGNLGNYGFLQLGGDLLRTEHRSTTWELDLGGYSSRGPAVGGKLGWDTIGADSGIRSRGFVDGFVVYDSDGRDQTGFQADDKLRWRVHTESRTLLTDDLHLDFEFGDFSDRGFNLEFFEREELTQKDSESYGRLYWAPDAVSGVVATLTGKWHQRDFVTETTLGPEGSLWLTGVPLLVPGRRGGFAVDVTSESAFGQMGRRFDGDLALSNYESWRLRTETRVNFGMDAGDVRLSGFAGGVADRYGNRDDGEPDLTRTAGIAGLRANLQLSRVYATQGGLLHLDGLRHVADWDLELTSRFGDSHDRDAVPFFDRRETLEDNTRVTLRMRNRLQTRTSQDVPAAKPRDPLVGFQPSGTFRNVIDWEVSAHAYINNQGPYGRHSPGAIDTTLTGALTPDFHLLGGLEVDFRKGTQTGAVGFGYAFGEPIGRVTVGAGVRYVRDESVSLRGDLEYRFSQKYALRTQGAFDFREALSSFRCVLRRHSEDHIWELGFRVRDGDLGLEFNIEPAIGGHTTRPTRVFDDEPTLNERALFRK